MAYDYEDDARFEFFSRQDYNREAYGDPCPRHGTLRWQADCPDCEAEEESAFHGPELPAPAVQALPAPPADDADIIF